MSGVATAIAGGAVVGAGVSIFEGNQARNAELDAANMANNTQTAEYNLNRNDQAPWREAGATALSDLNAKMPSLNKPFSMSDFTQDPGYNFRLQQGQKALEGSAAARGGLLGGDTMKALTNYNQDAASAEFGSAFERYNANNDRTFNRLASVAGLGQTATANVGAQGMNMANQVGANITGAGNAAAAGNVSTANTINSTIGTGMNTWMMNQYLNNPSNLNNSANRPANTSSPY